MVGVTMSEHGRMHDADVFSQELDSQLGRRVDQEIAARRVNQDARAGAVVFRIGRCADRTSTANHRNTDTRSRAQQNQFTGQTSAPETRSRRRR